MGGKCFRRKLDFVYFFEIVPDVKRAKNYKRIQIRLCFRIL